MDCLNESMFLFQAPKMTSVHEMGESMRAGSSHSYVPPGGGSAGPEGVNVGAAAGTLGRYDTKSLNLTTGCTFQNSVVT
jgi:hypothetical protein